MAMLCLSTRKGWVPTHGRGHVQNIALLRSSHPQAIVRQSFLICVSSGNQVFPLGCGVDRAMPFMKRLLHLVHLHRRVINVLEGLVDVVLASDPARSCQLGIQESDVLLLSLFLVV